MHNDDHIEQSALQGVIGNIACYLCAEKDQIICDLRGQLSRHTKRICRLESALNGVDATDAGFKACIQEESKEPIASAPDQAMPE